MIFSIPPTTFDPSLNPRQMFAQQGVLARRQAAASQEQSMEEKEEEKRGRRSDGETCTLSPMYCPLKYPSQSQSSVGRQMEGGQGERPRGAEEH